MCKDWHTPTIDRPMNHPIRINACPFRINAPIFGVKTNQAEHRQSKCHWLVVSDGK